MDGQLPNTHRVPSVFIFGSSGNKKFMSAHKSAWEQKNPDARVWTLCGNPFYEKTRLPGMMSAGQLEEQD